LRRFFKKRHKTVKTFIISVAKYYCKLSLRGSAADILFSLSVLTSFNFEVGLTA